jgi:nitroreductase
MELADLIKERRTIHHFEDRPVSIELVTELLNTAVWVPNHKMTQPWRFVIVQGEGRRRLADIARKDAKNKAKDPAKAEANGQIFYERFMSVPLYVVVVVKEDPRPATREEDYASAACLIHNFSLLAWEQDIGMIWETYALIHQPEFREALGVAEDESIVGSLHVGYPAKVPKPQRRIPVEQRLKVIDQA